MFPVIQYVRSLRRKLSDIEFLSIKEFQGKLVTDEGQLSATGDLATLTASSGKDMYLARAQCVFYQNTNGITAFGIDGKVELKINGTVVETGVFSAVANTTSSGTVGLVYDFKNIGHKVAATEIIKLEVVTISGGCDIEGFIECFEEDTGVSPKVV